MVSQKIKHLNFVIFILLAFCADVDAKIYFQDHSVVDKSNPFWKILINNQTELKEKYLEGGHSIPTFSPWIEINAPTADKIFPGLKFFSVQWSESRNPNSSKEKFVSLGYGLEKTLIINEETKEVVTTLFGSGNYVEYGELLKNGK